MSYYLNICSKNTGLQGSTLSDHCIGFSPICNLLQKGRDQSLPKTHYEKSSSWFVFMFSTL